MLFQGLGKLDPFQDCSTCLPTVPTFAGRVEMGTDVLARCLIDVLYMRSTTHTFVAFVDTHKAFDTSWVEATLVRLFSRRMWKLMAHYVHGTQPQVRLGSALSMVWQDSGIAQGRVLSPLARAVYDAAPGVSLRMNWDSRFASQLYTDVVVMTADSAAVLETRLDVRGNSNSGSLSELGQPNPLSWCLAPEGRPLLAV